MKLDRQKMGFKPQSVDEDEEKKVAKSVNEAEDLMLTIAEEHHTYVSIPWIEDIMRTLRRVGGENATPELAKFVADQLERSPVLNPGRAASEQQALGAGNQEGDTNELANLKRQLETTLGQRDQLARAFSQLIDASGATVEPNRELADYAHEVVDWILRHDQKRQAEVPELQTTKAELQTTKEALAAEKQKVAKCESEHSKEKLEEKYYRRAAVDQRLNSIAEQVQKIDSATEDIKTGRLRGVTPNLAARINGALAELKKLLPAPEESQQ